MRNVRCVAHKVFVAKFLQVIKKSNVIISMFQTKPNVLITVLFVKI